MGAACRAEHVVARIGLLALDVADGARAFGDGVQVGEHDGLGAVPMQFRVQLADIAISLIQALLIRFYLRHLAGQVVGKANVDPADVRLFEIVHCHDCLLTLAFR